MTYMQLKGQSWSLLTWFTADSTRLTSGLSDKHENDERIRTEIIQRTEVLRQTEGQEISRRMRGNKWASMKSQELSTGRVEWNMSRERQTAGKQCREEG